MDESMDMAARRVLVGERVAMIRLTHELKRADLALLLGVGENQMGKIERGETLLTVPQALRLRHALGVSLDVLYDEAERPREEVEFLTLLHRLTPANWRLALAIVRVLLAHQEQAPPDRSPGQAPADSPEGHG